MPSLIAHACFIGEHAGSFTFPTQTVDQIVEDVERGLAAAVTEAARLGAAQVTSRLLTGYPGAAQGLLDLVVMGTRGRTGLSHVLLESVAEKVVRHAPCPVLATHQSVEVSPFRNVLCPIDFCDSSRYELCPIADARCECGPLPTSLRIATGHASRAGWTRTRFAVRDTMITKLDVAQIDRVLYSEWFGHLGCHARERTYVVPMTYVYDGTSIISHTGVGLKVNMMRENPRVCFEVDRVNEDGSWQSAIVQGRFEELHGEEARHALQQLLDHLDTVEQWKGVPVTHGAGRFVPWREQGVARPEVVFRIRLDEKAGRSENLLGRVTA